MNRIVPHRDEHVSAQQFSALFGDLRRSGEWGEDDQRGALGLLTPKRVAAAAALVRDGVTVTLSPPLNTRAAAHNPMPADHDMTALASQAAAEEPVFLKDYVGLDYHNDGHTTSMRCVTSPTKAGCTTEGRKRS